MLLETSQVDWTRARGVRPRAGDLAGRGGGAGAAHAGRLARLGLSPLYSAGGGLPGGGVVRGRCGSSSRRSRRTWARRRRSSCWASATRSGRCARGSARRCTRMRKVVGPERTLLRTARNLRMANNFVDATVRALPGGLGWELGHQAAAAVRPVRAGSGWIRRTSCGGAHAGSSRRLVRRASAWSWWSTTRCSAPPRSTSSSEFQRYHFGGLERRGASGVPWEGEPKRRGPHMVAEQSPLPQRDPRAQDRLSLGALAHVGQRVLHDSRRTGEAGLRPTCRSMASLPR